jgi:hypothetical protein
MIQVGLADGKLKRKASPKHLQSLVANIDFCPSKQQTPSHQLIGIK